MSATPTICMAVTLSPTPTHLVHLPTVSSLPRQPIQGGILRSMASRVSCNFSNSIDTGGEIGPGTHHER